MYDDDDDDFLFSVTNRHLFTAQKSRPKSVISFSPGTLARSNLDNSPVGTPVRFRVTCLVG